MHCSLYTCWKNQKIKVFEEFSSNLGLAFQIKDDLLDIEGDEQEIGKKTQKDLSKGKETLISLMGKEKAKKNHEELIEKIYENFRKIWKKSKKSYRFD